MFAGVLFMIVFRPSARGQALFVHPDTDQSRLAPIGTSWTILLFGGFPALLRKDYRGAAILFLCAFASDNFSNLIFCFFYNKMYVKSLIEKGYLYKTSDLSFAEIEDALGVSVPQYSHYEKLNKAWVAQRYMPSDAINPKPRR